MVTFRRRLLILFLPAVFLAAGVSAAPGEGWVDPTKESIAAESDTAPEFEVIDVKDGDGPKDSAAPKEKKKKAKKPKKKKAPPPEWEPPSNAKWRLWQAGGFNSVIGPRAAQRATNGKSQWEAGLTYAKAPRWRLGVSYSALTLKGSARAQAVHLTTTRVLQPWEKWTPLVTYGLGTGHGPDSQSLKNISARAGLGMESFITRHLSVGLSGDYFYFAKAGSGKSEWHALATSVFIAQRFGYAKKKEPPEPEEVIAESTTTAAGEEEPQFEEIEDSTDAARSPEISTAPVAMIPGFAPPAPAVQPAAPLRPLKAALNPPVGWTSKTGAPQAVLYVQFDKNKFKLTPKHYEHLKNIAAFLKSHPEAKAFIEGHASSEGSLRFNLRLSRHRANVVRKFLIAKYNIEPSRLVTKGYGETHPLASNDTEAGRRKNRCAVSYIILKKKPAVAEPKP